MGASHDKAFVLGLLGSPRPRSTTGVLLERVLAGAAAAGARTELISLRGLDYSSCRHCGGCDKTGRCVVPDAIQDIQAKLRAAHHLVLASPIHKVKVSLRSPLMLPKVAIVDPALTHGLPPEITASTGLDALTQLIEALVSSRANPLTDSLGRDGIARAAAALPTAYAHARMDPEATERTAARYCAAREDMALASLWSGIALANAGLGAVHGFAGPLGGMFDAPHGAICAALLPEVMRTNIRALRQRAPNDRALERYTEVARLCLQQPEVTAEQGVDAVHRLCTALEVSSLSRFGVTVEQIPAVVAGARRASSMKANPIVLTDEELAGIIERSI